MKAEPIRPAGHDPHNPTSSTLIRAAEPQLLLENRNLLLTEERRIIQGGRWGMVGPALRERQGHARFSEAAQSQLSFAVNMKMSLTAFYIHVSPATNISTKPSKQGAKSRIANIIEKPSPIKPADSSKHLQNFRTLLLELGGRLLCGLQILRTARSGKLAPQCVWLHEASGCR